MGFDEVSSQLWRQRRVLEMLLFKLEEENLILTTGRFVWLERAASEIQDVVEELRQSESDRAQAVCAVAEELGLGSAPTLAELVDASPEPWDSILDQHQKALLETFVQIERVSGHNREILARGMAATADALSLLGEQPGTSYGADGAMLPGRRGARLVNSTI